MKRLALAVGIAAAVLVTLGCTLGGDLVGFEPASAEPTTIDSGAQTPHGCDRLAPSGAKSPSKACRDYLYQVHCQFDDDVADDEVWDEWCRERQSLNEGGPDAEVPDCNLALAAEGTEVGLRCRDHLAATRCFGGTTSEQEMEEFCAEVAPKAGLDPELRTCDTGLAQEPSGEGNQCWEQLKREFCSGWTEGDNTGAQDLNEFCDRVVAGATPPLVNPACDEALAKQDSTAGKACREQLYTSECALRSTYPPEFEAFCRQVAKEREEEADAREEEEAQERPGGPGEAQTSPDDPDEKKPSRGSPNVVLQLGREPACDRAAEFDEEVRRACAVTGSVMHSYPFANYGIDNNVSVDVLEDDFWSGETPIMSLFQWLMVAVWQALIWLVKIALLVLQWAFGVDPLTRSSGGIRDGVMGVFNLLGPEWRLTALAVLGVWAFWTGIVRMKFVQTFTGVAASVILMAVAMWIVYDPEGTIGKVAKWGNEGSLVVLSATSSGELKRPGQGLADGQRVVFDQLVVGGWCGMMFGGQEACAEKTGDGEMTRADLWLSLPANSTARGLLYKATKEGPDAVEEETDENVLGDFFDAIGDGLCYYSGGLTGSCEGDEDVMKSQTQEDREADPQKAKQFEEAKAKAMSLVKEDPGAVKLQGSDGVFTRAGLLLVIAIGIIGAVAFLLAIGVRLLTAGVILLLLILLAPVMLIVAAFGEEGRRRFITWLRMLAGAAMAKFVYSLVLGLVLLVVSILNDIPLTPMGLIFPEQAAAAEPNPSPSASADWLGNWVLVSAFFWVALLKLNPVLALIAPDPESERSNGLGAGAALWMGQRMVGQAMHGAWQGAMFLPRHAPRAARAARREIGLRRQATEGGIRKQADERLRDQNMAASRVDFAEQGKRAEQILGERGVARTSRRIGEINRILEKKNPSQQRRQALEAQRTKLEATRNRQEASERWARSELGRQSQGYREPNEGELRERRAQRRRDVDNWEKNGSSWSSESNRRWAGISDEEWQFAQRGARRGNDEPLQSLQQRSEQALERDRKLLAWRDDRRQMTPETRKEALGHWGRGTIDKKGGFSGYGMQPELARRVKEERQAMRRERRRGRDNLRPPNH